MRLNLQANDNELSYEIYHGFYNKCYFFTHTYKLKLVTLSIFPFDTKSVICKDRHLHIPKPNVGISEDDSPAAK